MATKSVKEIAGLERIEFEPFTDPVYHSDVRLVKQGDLYWQARIRFWNGTVTEGAYAVEVRAKTRDGQLRAWARGSHIYPRMVAGTAEKLTEQANRIAMRERGVAEDRIRRGVWIQEPADGKYLPDGARVDDPAKSGWPKERKAIDVKGVRSPEEAAAVRATKPRAAPQTGRAKTRNLADLGQVIEAEVEKLSKGGA